jgi:hypothetical protein
VVIELPRVQLLEDLSATVDHRLGEVRLAQVFEDGQRQLLFIPMARIRELCEMV